MLDIRTHAQHDNAGYSLADTPDAVLFDYVDQYADSEPEPVIMLAVLYPTGVPGSDPVPCEGHDHVIEPDQARIDIPDRTFCNMCPTHFHAAAL